MRNLWHRIVSKLTGEPVRYLRCPYKHKYRTPRYKWHGEVIEDYEECGHCGKEFYG